MKRALSLLMALGLSAAGGVACKTTRAETPVERPNLDVPPPPPRVIEPALIIEVPPLDPIIESPSAPTAGIPARPRPPRDPAATKPDVKQDAPPPETAPPATPTAPAAVPQLRTPGLASGPETAGEIRAILERAQGMLDKIDYGRLTKPRQNSYDTAKRFHAEAEKELKASNFVLAKELAEKAERLAKELQIR